MKKWLSLFLVMALSLSVCALAQAEEEKIYEGVTIQWQRYPAGDLEAQTAWNQSIVDAFYEETGCTVEVDMVSWEDANTKVLSAITADEGPDVVQIIETAAGQIYSSGAFVALDEYIDKFGGYDAYLQAGLDYGTYDGVLYGLPWGGDTRLYYTRQSVLDAAGIESIPDDWTWSDFLDVLDKIKAAGYEAPFATMGSISTDVSFYYYYTLISNGGNIISEDNTTALFDSEEARQTLKQIADLVVDGYMPASFAELSEDTLTAAFINGDVQMVPLSSGQVAAAAAAGVDDIVALYLPRGEDGTYGGIMCISLMSVPAYSEHQDAAMDFLAFLNSKEWQVSYNAYCSWIPGRHDAGQDEAFSEGWSPALVNGMAQATSFMPGNVHTVAINSMMVEELANFYASLSDNAYTDEEIDECLNRMQTLAQAELDS